MVTRSQVPGDSTSRLPQSRGRTGKPGTFRRFLRKSPRLVRAATGVVLLAVLGVLITRTQAVDVEVHDEVVALLRQLKQVDAEWNVDVLRSLSGPSVPPGAGAGALPLIGSLEVALRHLPGKPWNHPDAGQAALLQLLERNRQAMSEKAVLIERFKSQHAILRNSSRYLPVAAAEVLAGLDVLAPAARAPVVQAVNEVLMHVLVYVDVPEAPTATKITEALARLQRLGASLPADAAERVAGFAAHAATVQKQEQLSSQGLAALEALPTARGIDELSEAYALEHRKLLAAQQQDRWLLPGYSLLLLIALAHVAGRRWRSDRLFRKTSTELQRTNARLEDAQAHLVRSERMSALGQRVGGIADEIHASLAGVKGCVEQLGEQVALVAGLAARSRDFVQLLRDPQRSHDREQFKREFRGFEAASQEVAQHGVLDAMEQSLRDGRLEIEQISEIVTSLKSFGHQDGVQLSEFSVQEGLESTLILARSLLKNRVEIRREFGQVPKVHGSPSQINQVFLNLITNAVQAIPEDRAEPGIITLRTLMEGRDMLRVEVQDNGIGIPDDVLPRIFDPFFTTKAAGQGTGMGLSISFKIVQEHGGMILVDTVPGAGAVFAVLLPIRPRRGATSQAAGALASA